MAPESPPPKRKAERGKDIAGHEFAGEVALTERIAPPRPAPAPSHGKPPPRPPRAPGAPPPAAPAQKAPDPAIAGSKYFTASAAPAAEPRQMSSVTRERSKDSEALDSTIEDDLGEVTRRRERERASQGPLPEGAAPPAHVSGGPRKDLDAEARPRELDFSAPDMPRKRRT
jgi:hypothetical protein